MIKFFRKIRQNLLMQNKTTKYLKYAVGEVFLVMIGILLALQINTWKNKSDRNQLEKVLLQQLKYEMLTVYSDIYGDFNVLALGRRSHYRIINYIENNVKYHDSMVFDFAWINVDEYIFPKKAVYSKIKDEGLDIIKNDTIRGITQSLYENIFPRLSITNSFNPDISEVFDDYFLNHFKTNTDPSIKFIHVAVNDTISGKIYTDQYKYPWEVIIKGEKRFQTVGYAPLNFEALKKDHKFRMLLEKTNDYRTYKGSRYYSARQMIKDLVGKIDKYLDND